MKKKFDTVPIFNTLKIAGSALIAILLATTADIQFAVAAGIVTILTIQPTKKETIRTASGRFYAFMSAIAIAYVCFETLGYNLTGFSLYLILFIYVCQIFGWYSSMAMNSVLISHFLTLGDMSYASLYNEMAIFIIGVGIGIIANLHLHKDRNYILVLQQDTDAQIKQILKKMSERILYQDVSDYNESSFQELKKSIQKAQDVADLNFKNQFRINDTYDIEYIKMRDCQYHVLYEMYKSARTIETAPITAQIVSDLFLEMSENYHRDNSGEDTLQHFYEIQNSMKEKPLPVNRTEFEDRARLFILLNYIEEFIKIKQEFMTRF